MWGTVMDISHNIYTCSLYSCLYQLWNNSTYIIIWGSSTWQKKEKIPHWPSCFSHCNLSKQPWGGLLQLPLPSGRLLHHQLREQRRRPGSHSKVELFPTRWWSLMTRVLNHHYLFIVILLQKDCWCTISRTTDGVKIYREPIKAITSCEMHSSLICIIYINLCIPEL